MKKFIELPTKNPFIINLDNVTYIKADASGGVTIYFTDGTKQSFLMDIKDIMKLLEQ